MFRCILEGLAFALLALGALSFAYLLMDYFLIALASLAYVALTVAGYEIARRHRDRC